MSAPELREEILKEAEKNPALEVVSDLICREDVPCLSYADGRASAEEKSRAHRDFFEKVLAREETLQERLNAQLCEARLPPKTMRLARAVITCLDANGFLAVPPETLPGAEDAALLDEALSAVRRLEPAGCAARDALHSLAIQAEIRAGIAESPDDKRRYSLLALLLKSGIKAEGNARHASLAAAAKSAIGSGLSAREAARLEQLLRTLDPFPGRNFSQGEVAGAGADQFVVPDIIVVKEDDVFQARMNDDEIPVVRVSPCFERLEEEDEQGKKDVPAMEEMAFVRESLESARCFINALKRRRKTVLKVAAVVIARQQPFFERGAKFLLPLRMRDVANELGLHEATVSRTVAGKYLQCEWGVFSLRYFFNSSARAQGKAGEAMHKESVKEIIREMLAKAKKKPSDREIAERLAERGIQIARRTVAKYRGELEK